MRTAFQPETRVGINFLLVTFANWFLVRAGDCAQPHGSLSCMCLKASMPVLQLARLPLCAGRHLLHSPRHGRSPAEQHRGATVAVPGVLQWDETGCPAYHAGTPMPCAACCLTPSQAVWQTDLMGPI